MQIIIPARDPKHCVGAKGYETSGGGGGGGDADDDDDDDDDDVEDTQMRAHRSIHMRYGSTHMRARI